MTEVNQSIKVTEVTEVTEEEIKAVLEQRTAGLSPKDKELFLMGDWLHGILNDQFPDKDWNDKLVRSLVILKYGKRVAKRYNAKELRYAWFQYEPQ